MCASSQITSLAAEKLVGRFHQVCSGARSTAGATTRSSAFTRDPSLQANVHPKVVQERLGHANIAITMDL